MAWDIGNLFKALKNQGSSQGGGSGVRTLAQTVGDSNYGRMLQGEKSPAYSDALEGTQSAAKDFATSYDPSMEEGRITSQHAQDFAKNMDVSSKEDVFEMQNMLNQLGFKDYEGKELSTDAIMGDRTLSAMRQLQDRDYYNPTESSFDYEPGKGPSGPEGSDKYKDVGGESTMMRNVDRGSSPNSWISKLFGSSPKDRSAYGNEAAKIMGDKWS